MLTLLLVLVVQFATLDIISLSLNYVIIVCDLILTLLLRENNFLCLMHCSIVILSDMLLVFIRVLLEKFNYFYHALSELISDLGKIVRDEEYH